MTKERIKNLRHAFRWMRRQTSVSEAVAWIRFYSERDWDILRKIYG